MNATRAEPILALCGRLAQHLARTSDHDLAADLRLARGYLKQMAAVVIAEEAKAEADPERRLDLLGEAADLWRQRGTVMNLGPKPR
jgi:hypothetical protein